MARGKPFLVGHAEVDRRRGTRKDPAIELMMKHVELGEVDVAEVAREFIKIRSYGVEVTVEMMAKAIAKIKDYKKRHPPEAPKPRLPEVVYYMRLGNRVKIGTSTNLVERLKTFQPEELMVTESGGSKLERKRHRQFAHLRVSGEWFKLEGELVEHIAKLRETW